jgi:hypothetical protein
MTRRPNVKHVLMSVVVIALVGGAILWFVSDRTPQQAKPATSPSAPTSSQVTKSNPLPKGWVAAKQPIDGISFVQPESWTFARPDNTVLTITSPDYQPQPSVGTRIVVNRYPKPSVKGQVIKTVEELKAQVDSGAIPSHFKGTMVTISGMPALKYGCGDRSNYCYAVSTARDFVVITVLPVTSESQAMAQIFVDHLVIQ